MPYANNQGVRIHYQIEGNGPALALQHGFTDSLENWYDLVYVNALKQDYRLILVDARGHGASDKSQDPHVHAWQFYVADLIAVLEHLHIPTAHFFGYSMGGSIGFAIAQFAPHRFASSIIGGGLWLFIGRILHISNPQDAVILGQDSLLLREFNRVYGAFVPYWCQVMSRVHGWPVAGVRTCTFCTQPLHLNP
jgi:pimeloyl-ACP methyl ester carboxylesterase